MSYNNFCIFHITRHLMIQKYKNRFQNNSGDSQDFFFFQAGEERDVAILLKICSWIRFSGSDEKITSMLQ